MDVKLKNVSPDIFPDVSHNISPNIVGSPDQDTYINEDTSSLTNSFKSLRSRSGSDPSNCDIDKTEPDDLDINTETSISDSDTDTEFPEYEDSISNYIDHNNHSEKRYNPQIPRNTITEVIENNVINAKTYIDLPDRIIISTEYMTEAYLSYGIIPYCTSTKRWLMIMRRHSLDFILFMRGSYKKSELEEMFQRMSRNELNLISKSMDSEETFKEIFHGVIFGKKQSHRFAYDRMNQLKDVIIKIINNTTCYEQNYWFWPKGSRQLTSQGIMETPFKCAMREFNEETGLYITDTQKQVSHDTINDSFKAKHGQIYESKLWVFLFPEEIEPPPISNLHIPGEIGARKWVTTEEAIILLRSNTYTIEMAINMIRNSELIDPDSLPQIEDIRNKNISSLSTPYLAGACKTTTEHMSEIIPYSVSEPSIINISKRDDSKPMPRRFNDQTKVTIKLKREDDYPTKFIPAAASKSAPYTSKDKLEKKYYAPIRQ